MNLELKFNDMLVASISSNLEYSQLTLRLVKVDLYKPKPREENLDDIFGDNRMGQDTKIVDKDKKEEVKVEYKQESAIKVTNKFKVSKPLV